MANLKEKEIIHGQINQLFRDSSRMVKEMETGSGKVQQEISISAIIKTISRVDRDIFIGSLGTYIRAILF